MKNLFNSWLLFFSLFSIDALAQPINLDKPVKAGELTCFPDIGNAAQFYYISDKPKLATGTNGKPQFSFLRYVDNKLSGVDQPGVVGSNEGDGGGIVHAVVSLEVTDDQRKDAQRELQRIVPNALLVGPVVYKSGKFGIVSSFKDPAGGLSKQVVGLGNAPVLDGQKAAVSIQLTKQGAKILWESFKTVAPDISFTFEMEVTGYRSPKKATIEANFDQIYEHKGFSAGIASTFLAAEIKASFDDLVRNGAIKVTQIGEDDKMESMISTAYNKIAELMFSPMNGTGNMGPNELGALTGGNGGTSVLDRATTMLAQGRTEARAINSEEDQRRRTEEDRRRAAGASSGAGSTTGGTSGGAASSGGATSGGSTSSGGASGATASGASSGTETASMRPASSYGSTAPSGAGTDAGRARPTDAPTPGGGTSAAPQVSLPTFAIVASFEMKRVRQQGIFKIDLNKSTTDNVSMRFDENIGDLTRYMNDVNVFREVNLDDPLYVQREVAAFIDGMNSQDFGQYINFVSLRLKKTHEAGDITNQEIRIDRNNFNKEGNNFRMLYGWKSDRERKKWMDYEYETEWSFFGGNTIKVPLQKATGASINLAPPYQKRTVEFQADQTTLSTNSVRLVTVKLFYELGGKELTKQVTLNPSKGQLSEKLDFMLPTDSYDYQYEITWRTMDNQSRTSGKKKSNEAILFVDSL